MSQFMVKQIDIPLFGIKPYPFQIEIAKKKLKLDDNWALANAFIGISLRHDEMYPKTTLTFYKKYE